MRSTQALGLEGGSAKTLGVRALEPGVWARQSPSSGGTRPGISENPTQAPEVGSGFLPRRLGNRRGAARRGKMPGALTT